MSFKIMGEKIYTPCQSEKPQYVLEPQQILKPTNRFLTPDSHWLKNSELEAGLKGWGAHLGFGAQSPGLNVSDQLALFKGRTLTSCSLRLLPHLGTESGSFWAHVAE